MGNEARTEKIDARTTPSVKKRVESRLADDESPSEWAHRAFQRELEMQHEVDQFEAVLQYLALGATLVFLLSLALAVVGVVGNGIVIYMSGTFAAMLLAGYTTRVALRRFGE